MSDKEFWENIVSDNELTAAYRARNKDYVYQRQRADALPSLQNDGWEYVSTYKDERFIRVQKQKPLGERFENKVWLMLYGMGYSKMNRDDKFVISYSKANPDLTQQIDVFAVDDETAIIVECKTAEKASKKDFKTEIDAYKGNIGEIIKAVRKQYGKKLKTTFIWATHNIVLGEQDKTRLEDAGFEYFDEETVEYYIGLTKHLGVTARYQFLGRLFRGRNIDEMPSTVPAIKGKMGGHVYYSFSIEPERLLKIGYVLHRSDANRGMMPTYQRIIKKSRLKAIREFVDGGGYFPNSIIVSIDAPKRKGLRFDLKYSETDSDTQIGVLYLPKRYSSAYIIDGQHRLYGYSDSEYARTNTIPVVAFENLSKKEQIDLFMEINENQKAVPKNLRNTLDADRLWVSDDYSERRKALRLKIAQELGETLGSPLYDRVLIGENATTDTRCITMEAIDKGLREGNFFTDFDGTTASKVGLLDNADGDNEYARNLVVPFLMEFFGYVSKELKQEWDLGKEAQGILSINTGVYALLHVSSDIVQYVNDQGIANPRTLNAKALTEQCRPFLEVIVDFYRNISPELRNEIKRQYGDKGSTNHWRYLQKAIHDHFNDFNPSGLSNWWADNSKEYNGVSRAMLSEISYRVKSIAADTLLEIKGPQWRANGLPGKLVIKLSTKVAQANVANRSNGDLPIDTWDLVTMDECAAIAISGSNWTDGFKEVYTRPEFLGKRSKKDQSVKWINDMVKYQNKLDKPGASISRSEFEYISSIVQWLSPGFKLGPSE